MIAHYYCELAEQVFAKKNIIIARAYVKQAFDNDPRCLRASILLGDIEAAEGNDREAIQAWRQVEEQDAHYLGEVAGRIAEGFRRLKDEQGLYDYFRTALQRYGGVALALTFADIIRQRDGVDAAQKFVVDWLRRKPGSMGCTSCWRLTSKRPRIPRALTCCCSRASLRNCARNISATPAANAVSRVSRCIGNAPVVIAGIRSNRCRSTE